MSTTTNTTILPLYDPILYLVCSSHFFYCCVILILLHNNSRKPLHLSVHSGSSWSKCSCSMLLHVFSIEVMSHTNVWLSNVLQCIHVCFMCVALICTSLCVANHINPPLLMKLLVGTDALHKIVDVIDQQFPLSLPMHKLRYEISFIRYW